MDLGKALEGQALPDGLAEPLHGGGSSCLTFPALQHKQHKHLNSVFAGGFDEVGGDAVHHK